MNTTKPLPPVWKEKAIRSNSLLAMRKLPLLFFFLLFSSLLHSQVLIALLLGDKLNTGNIEFGLDGGLNYASISEMDSNGWNRNFNLGFYFDFRLKNNWFFNTGVLVKSTLGVDELTDEDLEFLGATVYDQDGKYNQKIDYFLVPALMKYKFDNHIHLEGGLQFGLAHGAYIQFDSDIDGNSARIRENNKDMIHTFDMGAAAGAGYRLLKGLGWTIGVRYYHGFLNVYKDLPGSRNQALFLKLNVPMGLSLEKKEEIKKYKNEKKAAKAEKKAARKKAKESQQDPL